MTRDEKTLLLTVARIMRSHALCGEIVSGAKDDLWALNEALAPFNPTPAQQAILGAGKESA